MGNCCFRCFGIHRNKRQYLRTRYNIAKDFSIEFENLMEDDVNDEIHSLHSSASAVGPVSEFERQLLRSGNLRQLLHEHDKQTREIQAKLAAQEEELRQEEEAYYAAKREAARAAKLQRNAQLRAAAHAAGVSESAPVDDDFIRYMNKVRSQASVGAPVGSVPQHTPAAVAAAAVALGATGRPAVAAAAAAAAAAAPLDSNSSCKVSVDLDWDHEPGMDAALSEQQVMIRSATEEDLMARLTADGVEDRGGSAASVTTAPDLEWEHEHELEQEEYETGHLLEQKQARG